MSPKPTWLSNQPTPMYAFVVLALAAFLAMFTVWRTPGISYEIQAAFFSTEMDHLSMSEELRQERAAELRTLIIDPAFVLESLRAAEMIQGEATPELLKVGTEIASRLNVSMVSAGERHIGYIQLQTDHPEPGQKLLNSMVENVVSLADYQPDTLVTIPAEVTAKRGGSVTPGTLMIFLVLASVIGQVGVILAHRVRRSDVLLSNEDVEEVAGVRVVGDLVETEDFPLRTKQMRNRRMLKYCVRVAEVGIAAVFALMVYRMASGDAFFSRFIHDPLAAYGEVLTQVIG